MNLGIRELVSVLVQAVLPAQVGGIDDSHGMFVYLHNHFAFWPRAAI